MKIITTTAVFLTVTLSTLSLNFAEEPEFVPLFDGKTLQGWEGNQAIFRVEEGAIIGGTLKERIPHNEFLSTRKRYENFELRFEAKLIGKGRNAGVQFRSERIPDHHEMIGYQCDIGIMGGKQNIWGALYDESRRRKFLAIGPQAELKEKFQPDDWNELVVRCQGKQIQIWVNGVKTVDYMEQEPEIAQSGVIGLQIHGGPPAEASYRNIRIKELK